MNLKEALDSAKKFWKKFWFLLWKDDSLKGWIFSVAFMFIFVKFIFLPTLGLIAGTSLPLAIVESCSMYHKGDIFSDFTIWWEKHESKYSEFFIEKNEFENFIFKNGFNKGDILFITRADPEKLKIGDVIIFEAGKQNPLIHRVIKIREENKEKIFSSIGDNNYGQLNVEENIKQEQLVGKAVFKIAPFIGWTKLIFFEHLKPVNERGLCEEN